MYNVSKAREVHSLSAYNRHGYGYGYIMIRIQVNKKKNKMLPSRTDRQIAYPTISSSVILKSSGIASSVPHRVGIVILLIRLVSPILSILTLLVPIRPIAQTRVISMVQVIIRLPLGRRHRCRIHTGRARVSSSSLRAVAGNLEDRIERDKVEEPG